MIRFVIVDLFGNLFGPFDRATEAARWAATQWRDEDHWHCAPIRSSDYLPLSEGK